MGHLLRTRVLPELEKGNSRILAIAAKEANGISRLMLLFGCGLLRSQYPAGFYVYGSAHHFGLSFIKFPSGLVKYISPGPK